jgi:flagellar motor switch protein FliN/FliY
MSGTAPGVLSSQTPIDLGATPLWSSQPLEPEVDAIIWAGAGEAAWTSIGSVILGAAGVDNPSQEDLRGTYLEVIQQASSGIAQALSAAGGPDLRCGPGQHSGEGPPSCLVHLDVQLEGAGPVSMAAGFSPRLLELVSEGLFAATVPVATASVDTKMGESGTRQTIDLLYEVELPLSVSFGRAHLPLKEVLKLTSGSIVELNRTVSEPVEVIVNNCVIARGEVVVVDGNYGVRVTQILSRRDRLRTLY